jgi:hypothetical protein
MFRSKLLLPSFKFTVDEVGRFFRKDVTCLPNCTSHAKCAVLILTNLGTSSLLRIVVAC